ncbi:SIR2 family NAD-dependent protein deacylase [Hymenobacter sp. PAMC 26628]|uniref:SIR2 family NAD-dependent protein deacylase n=1 Tax=Hymenobacter sp. PAMC 26628 TaxID=1484118 RepID=UPI00076FE6A1|nr:NAD-dependent deacylase [Hymenobacter sp. PAMC 26628]AMJ65381.1 NAD-dependent deacylase [Hymenobacter sp. PAMC 26628]
MQHLVVLTGAGVSAESGIRTFRDTNGLWEDHRVEDVASPEGFARDPALVLDFYNQRRRQAKEVQPNAAHRALAGFEAHPGWRVSIITQNVDDLHERAGSTDVLHLHGMLNQMRTVADETTVYDCPDDIKLGDLGPDGAQLRPHIVWFGEMVPAIEEAAETVATADALLVVGTSLQVYPAAGLLHYAPAACPVFVIDPHQPPAGRRGVRYVVAPASTGVPEVLAELGAP